MAVSAAGKAKVIKRRYRTQADLDRFVEHNRPDGWHLISVWRQGLEFEAKFATDEWVAEQQAIEAAHPKPPPEPTELVPEAARAEILSMNVSFRLANGWNLVDRDDRGYRATLSLPAQQVNHVVYALFTIFTFGLVGILWIWEASTARKEQRLGIFVDEYGRIREGQGGTWMR